MVSFGRALPHERDEIIDLANYVFSASSRPHDFKKLLPKVYGDTAPVCTDFHFVARDEGRIRAMVAVKPVPMEVAGHSLMTGFVGTVSVHPYDRGSGYMKALMNMALTDARQQGMAFCALGGARQRYEYFGFSQAGIKIEHHVNQDNLRHACAALSIDGLGFANVKEDDASWLDAAYALYEKEPIRGARNRPHFLTICESWSDRLYAILRDGKFVGCLIAEDGNIYELMLEDAGDTLAVVKGWQAFAGKRSIRINLPAYAQKMHLAIGSIAESTSFSPDLKVNILDYPKTVAAYLDLQQRIRPLAEGCLTLQVDGAAPFTMAVKGGKPEVTRTNLRPDLSLSHMEAQNLLLSMLPTFIPTRVMPAGWFPLPLDYPCADRF